MVTSPEAPRSSSKARSAYPVKHTRTHLGKEFYTTVGVVVPIRDVHQHVEGARKIKPAAKIWFQSKPERPRTVTKIWNCTGMSLMLLQMSDVELVQLDRDHPGFRDANYRQRRQQIASMAIAHKYGEPCKAVAYTPLEREVWKIVSEKLSPLHQRYACDEFLEAWPSLGFRPDEIPQFEDINARMKKLTGFQFSPVAGLVSPRVFLEALSEKVFLATQYMRHHTSPLYTPEPDVIHELIGHAALLAHPRFAKWNVMFGKASLSADDTRMQSLIRMYWYVLEFGLLRTPSGLKAIGAGLLSSVGEITRFESTSDLRAFSTKAVAKTPFDPTDYQKQLFVAESCDHLDDALNEFLGTG